MRISLVDKIVFRALIYMEQISDAEFLATPLCILAGDPGQIGSQFQSPGTRPVFPGRSEICVSKHAARERSFEFDNFRQIKHADPYGRVTLGRRFSFKSFVVEELTHGALLLRPAVIMEKREFDHLHSDLTKPRPALYNRIPTMR